jgi:chromosome segregation ATPase
MRKIALALVLVAACGRREGPDPEIARLNGVITSLRSEMAADRAAKEKEIADLRVQLADATKKAEESKGLLDQFKAATETTIVDLRKGLEAKAKEALDALAKAGDLEQRMAGLDVALSQTKTALQDAKTSLAKRTADFDALKAEISNLKKLLGK